MYLSHEVLCVQSLFIIDGDVLAFMGPVKSMATENPHPFRLSGTQTISHLEGIRFSDRITMPPVLSSIQSAPTSQDDVYSVHVHLPDIYIKSCSRLSYPERLTVSIGTFPPRQVG